jgi:biopolymer transport protein ExbB
MKLLRLFPLLLLPALPLLLPAADSSFSAAQAAAGRDLDAALAELAWTRSEIAREKVPLIREVSALENEVEEKTRELERLLRLRDNRDLGLNRLREQVKAMEAQNEYIAGLLDEFVRSFETRIHFSETQLYAAAAEEARLALEDADMGEAERFGSQLEVIRVALERLGDLAGGYTFEGKGLTPAGVIETGVFAVVGPSVYFSSKESGIAGISYNKLNAAEAAIAVPGPGFAAGITALINEGEGRIPVDPTLGKALKIEQGNDSALEHIAKGGAVGYVIIGLGLVCLVIGIYKSFQVTGFKTPPPEKVQEILAHLEAGDNEKARSSAAALPGAGGELLVAGVENADEKRGTLEEILFEKVLSVRPLLEKLLPFMALTAAAAPLLGLLGTVTGMIKTFNLITIFGTGDAKSLSSGISEALVTTELGLIVAIPSLILHGLLSRMSRQKLGALEQTMVGFINGVIGIRSKSD